MYENDINDIIEAQNGNKEAMQKLINTNKGLIWNVVKRFKERGHEIEDIYQIGCMGFIKAIQRFDTKFDVKLSTYAVPYMLGEIKRFIRDDGLVKVSRSTKELYLRIRELQNENSKKNGTELTINQIANKLKVSKEEISFALDAIRPVQSIDEDVYDDNGNTKLVDQIKDNKDEANMIATKLALKKIIEGLNKREKQIVILRYFKEQTQAQVAKALGITQVQVSRIEKKILNSMKTKMIS